MSTYSQMLFSDNPHYVLYESQLIEIHALISKGKGSSEEACALRDAMELPERELADAELNRLNRLSADLYMLQGRERYECMGTDEGTPEQLTGKVRAAWAAEDWDLSLRLLRKGDAGFSPEQVAYVRARAYEELGHVRPALVFLRYAARLRPQSLTYHCLMMQCLLRLRRFEEAAELAAPYFDDPAAAFALRVYAGSVLFASARGHAEGESTAAYERIVAGLDAVADSPGFSGVTDEFRTLAYVTLGFCFDGLNRVSEASAAFAEAVALNPGDDRALVARGLLLALRDPADAVADFQLAVEGRTPIITPYLFLTQHFLLHGNFRGALEMAEAGVRLTENPRLLAELRQAIAIARLGMGAPEGDVQREFETALELDPLNDRVRLNSEYFRSRRGTQALADWREMRWPEHGYPDLSRARAELRRDVLIAA